MSSHTPGPWKTETYSNAEVRDGERIRSANNLVVVPEVWGASLAECEANYNLIAAAPELLAALSTLVEYMLESHAEELENCHAGDAELAGEAPEACSYCQAIAGARAAMERAGTP